MFERKNVLTYYIIIYKIFPPKKDAQVVSSQARLHWLLHDNEGIQAWPRLTDLFSSPLQFRQIEGEIGGGGKNTVVFVPISIVKMVNDVMFLAMIFLPNIAHCNIYYKQDF